MDLALLNSSMEYSDQNVEQEVKYSGSLQIPSCSSSEMFSNSDELLSFIGDSNFNFHFMDTLDKLNSPVVDSEPDIRDSLLEFLQEQLKSSDLSNIKNDWIDFDNNAVNTTSSLCSYLLQDLKQLANNSEISHKPIHTGGNIQKCNLCYYVANDETDLESHVESHSVQEYNPDLLIKTEPLDVVHDSEMKYIISGNPNRNNNVTRVISMPCNTPSVANVKKEFDCRRCNYSTEKKCKLKIHMLTHIGGKNLICCVCDYETDRSTYLVHIKQHNCSSFECPLCCVTVINEAVLIKHITQHRNKYACPVCYHSTTHNTPVTKQVITQRFSCTVCSFQTKYKTFLQKHLLNHNRIFECDLCDYKASTNKMIIDHRVKHSSTYFKCKFCDFQTVYKTYIKKHEGIHNGEKRFVCQVCGIRFAQKSNLKAHIVTHAGDKSYECYLCDYKAAQKINLKAHVITHIGETNLACIVCSYKAYNRNTLKTHMTLHNAEKIFDCTFCNYKSAHRSGLRRHLRMHTGEKDLLCEVCNYKTSRKDYLNRHMLKHTGEKSLECSFCDYKTAYRNSLNVHNALIHSKDL